MSMFWKRVEAGKSVALVGAKAPDLGSIGPTWTSISLDWSARLEADAWSFTASYLESLALHRGLERARERVSHALAARLPSLAVLRTPEQEFAEALERLHQRAQGHFHLCLIAPESSSPASRERLVRALVQTRARMPLILQIRDAQAAGARPLLEALRSHGGAEAVVCLDAAPSAQEESASLPERVRQTLRALAFLGKGASLDDLGRVLERSVSLVLEDLQLAVEGGVRIQDRGDGKMTLLEPLASRLNAQLLPSLQNLWRERLGSVTEARMSMVSGVFGASAVFSGVSMAQAPQVSPSLRIRVAQHSRQSEGGSSSREGWDEPTVVERPAASPMQAASAEFTLPPTHEIFRPLRVELLPPTNDADAIEAISARDEVEEARFDAFMTRLRSRLEQSTSLEEEFFGRSAETQSLLDDVESALLVYREGEASKVRQAARDLAVHAEVDVNSEAALDAAYILMLVSALELRAAALSSAAESLWKAESLVKQLPRDSVDAKESNGLLAEIHHLLAKLVLRLPPSAPNLQQCADLALGHAQLAEQLCLRAARRIELGRVWETMARLEGLRGEANQAIEHLLSAIHVQRTIGDTLGLARSTKAAVEMLMANDRPAEALELLTESLNRNVDKGSLAGLSLNREAVESLRAALRGAESPPEINATLLLIDEQLRQAESFLDQSRAPASIHP